MSESDVKPSKILVSEGPVEDVAVFGAPGSVEGFHGDVRPGRQPTLAITQRVGQNAKDFKPGQLLYNREKTLPAPLSLSFFGIHCWYQPNAAYDPNQKQPAITYETALEVERAGGNLRRGVTPGSDPHNFVSVARALVVLESPVKKGWGSDIDLAMPFEEKTLLIPCAWFLRGIGFSRVVEPLRITSARLSNDKLPMIKARWTLEVADLQINGNWVFVPILSKQDKQNNDDYCALSRKLFGA